MVKCNKIPRRRRNLRTFRENGGVSKKEILKMYKVFKNFALKVSKFKIKARMPVFPEYISEYLIMTILNESGICGKVTKLHKGGDLFSTRELKIECKCFSSPGPLSFGPKESWNKLYVLDGTKYLKHDYFKLYRINMTNREFDKIMINKHDTYKKQRLLRKRPRIGWSKLYPQILHKCKIIFDDNIYNM